MFTQLLGAIGQKRGVNFAGQGVKIKALTDLRVMMSRLDLIWPQSTG